jgi:hypothetical protein
MMQFVASSMLFVVMMVMNVTAFMVLLHVMHMVFVLMGVLVTSGVNVLVMFVMFAVHDKLLISCGGA